MNVTIRGRTQHYRTVAFDRARNSILLIEQRLSVVACGLWPHFVYFLSFAVKKKSVPSVVELRFVIYSF